MNLNLFNWIREGVRQSVLAGVSDAVEQIGIAADGDDLRPHLAEALRRSSAAIEAPAATEPRTRRLGRSIKDFDISKEK